MRVIVSIERRGQRVEEHDYWHGLETLRGAGDTGRRVEKGE